MRISKRDQRLLLILLGLAVFLFTYLSICKSYDAKKDSVQTQIDSLSPRLSELQGYYANLSAYQDGISQIEDSVSTELSKFPADVRSEDLIMYSNELEQALGIKVQSINIVPPELISQFNIPKKTDDGFKLVPVAAMRTGINIECSLNYEQYKKLIDYIYSTKERTTLKSISVTYNSGSGGLTGSVSLEKYFVSSADYAYEKTDIPSVETGVSDPFGTLSLTTDPTKIEPPKVNEEN